MRSLTLHRLVANPGGIILPLIACDAPVSKAPVDNAISPEMQIKASGRNSGGDIRKRAGAAAVALHAFSQKVDK